MGCSMWAGLQGQVSASGERTELGCISTCPFFVKGVIPREKASQTWNEGTCCPTIPCESCSEGHFPRHGHRGGWEDGKLRYGCSRGASRGRGKGQREGMGKLAQDLRKKGCFQSLSLLLSVPGKQETKTPKIENFIVKGKCLGLGLGNWGPAPGAWGGEKGYTQYI